VLDVPIDVPRPRIWSVVGSHQQCLLDSNLIAPLQEVNPRATPFAVVTASFGIVLSRLSRDSCVYMGTPFALRTLASVQNLIGDFVNMLLFKVGYDPTETYMSVLDRATVAAADVQRYSMAPFLLLVNTLQKYLPTKDPSRNPISQTMIDVVPNETDDPSEGMSGIFDIFLFANTRQGQLWSIQATYNKTILEEQTVRMIMLQMPVLTALAARNCKMPLPRSLTSAEEVQLMSGGDGLVLTHLRMRVGPLPHIVGIKAGWEDEDEPQECQAVRASRRLKRHSGLQLSADLPLTGTRAQRPPAFVLIMEQSQHEAARRGEEERAQRRRQQEERLAARQQPEDEAPAVAGQGGGAARRDVKEVTSDPNMDVLAEIEARRAQVRRKLAARSSLKGRIMESEVASELIGLDHEYPHQGARRRPRALNGRR